jgi:Ala-tRNA(Pro) deacylase
MPTERLKRLLDDNGVRYETICHTTAYTAQGVAATSHVRGRDLAKSTVVKVDDHFGLAVVPAPRHVDLEALRRLIGAGRVSLASEPEFQGLFPDCELGAMPPFGNLYGLPVWVDAELRSDPTIVFNAGNHREAIRLTFADFERLAKPTVGAFAAG